MNLTWHIVRKDLRRFWFPLVVVSAITLVRFGIGHLLLTANAPGSDWFVRMGMYSDGLQVLGFAVVYLLVAAVVQADSVAAPAFWQTRPISRSRLLAAKALGLSLMFGLLPVLVAIPWWLYCGFGGREMFIAAAGVAGIQAGVVLVALPWAVVTDGFGRFLMYSVVAAVAGFACFVTIAVKPPVAYAPTNGVGVTLLILALGIASTVSVVVVVHQFVTRRNWRSIALIVAGGACLFVVARRSTWDASHFWAPRHRQPGGLSRDVSISLMEGRLYGVDEKGAQGTIVVSLEGVPSGFRVINHYSDQKVSWPDGSGDRQARSESFGLPTIDGEASRLLGIDCGANAGLEDIDRIRTWRRTFVRHDYKMPAANKNLAAAQFQFVAWGEDAKRLTKQPATLESHYWFDLVDFELVGEQSLEVGAEFKKGSLYSRVADIERDPVKNTLRLSVVERSPSFPTRKLDPEFAYVNSDRNAVREGLNEVVYKTVIDGVEVALRHDSYQGLGKWSAQGHRWVPIPGFFDRGTLVNIQPHMAQLFDRELVVNDFLMKPPYASNTADVIGGVIVSGAVKRPSSVEVHRGETVLDALRNAGGFTDTSDMSAVKLVRVGDDGLPTKRVLDVGAYLEGRTTADSFPTLQPGDLVEVDALK